MKYHIHPKHKIETERTTLANRTIYSLILYGFYDLWPGNGMGLILTVLVITRGEAKNTTHMKLAADYSDYCNKHVCITY